jgi:hypothetical protein
VADGLGVAVERVTEPAAIIPALQRAIRTTGYGSDAGSGRPALVEFMTWEETRLSRPWQSVRKLRKKMTRLASELPLFQ